MPKQPRLPNGRFARVIQLPPGNARGIGKSVPQGMTGAVIVRTNAAAVAEQVRAIPPRVERSLFDAAEKQAERVQARLRAETRAGYNKASTGRFSRGLFAKATKIDGGAAIRISMFNYRESRFLTNLGGKGAFQFGYPIPPYRIYAKNAEGIEVSINSARGSAKLISHKSAMRRLSLRANVGRLKVPREGNFFVAMRKPGRGGGESRILNDWANLDPTNPSNSGFFYPLWVDHPGFARDIVSEVVESENARIINEVTELVRYEHTNLGGGEFRSTPRPVTRADQTVVRTVSDIIPLPDLSVRLVRKQIGFGTVEGAGLERLNRAIE